ncbi:hypothetical protein BDW62DRAFT_107578 [Aspergillus aurantiobrunneus]
MKFTGILASLAIASTAAALPANLDVVKIQSTVTRVDNVVSKLDGAVAGGSVTNGDLADVKADLGGISGLLNNLLGGAGKAADNNLVGGVLNLAGGVVSSVVGTLSGVTHVADYDALSSTLLSRVQSGEVDAAGLQNVLSVVGGDNGIVNLNQVLSQA